MVLFQVPISGLTNAKIVANIPCPFYGTYKVTFLNFELTWSTNPNVVLRLNSNALITNFNGGQIFIGSNAANYVVLSTTPFEFISPNLSGYIDIEVTSLTGTTPANFTNALFSFNFEKIN